MREWVDFQEALGNREVAIGAYDAILRYSAHEIGAKEAHKSHIKISKCITWPAAQEQPLKT